MPTARQWWHDAVIYQVYLRSFADANGDGIGDIKGLQDRLPYLVDLGVDAVWITPWYRSPMADGGYDIADFRDIDPLFGTLDDADTLVAAAHAAGLRVIIDLPANHTSDMHPWFQDALHTAPYSRERARYFFRDGRGNEGELPPNDWISAFGGPAWTRTTRPDGQPGQWYLHLCAPEQPDLDWTNPEVRSEFTDILRFWFDRGVDGMRIDAVSAMAKVPGLPDAGHPPGARFESSTWVDNPHWDVDELHSILREFRIIADTYGPDRMFVAEAIVRSPERLARYVRPDELHTAFNFDFPRAGWNPAALREAIDRSRNALREVGAPATWVLSSHDETRHLTRFGRADTSTLPMTLIAGTDSDLVLGTRRARAAALLMLSLPGGAYLYQGEELGLEEVADLPEELLQDPTWERSGHTIRGRDGCRVPLPWDGDLPPFGFCNSVTQPWLPQPYIWKSKTVAAESNDPDSMLTLYRTALHFRRTLPALRGDCFAWRPMPTDVLAFDRGPSFRCVVNLSRQPLAIDPDTTVLLASADLTDVGYLPPDTAVWLRTHR